MNIAFPRGAVNISVCKYVCYIQYSWRNIYFTQLGTDWKRWFTEWINLEVGRWPAEAANVSCGKWLFISSKAQDLLLGSRQALRFSAVQTCDTKCFLFFFLPFLFFSLCHLYNKRLERAGVSFYNSIRNRRLWRKN